MPESEGFERFATYCVISREHPETFKVEDVIVGGGNDAGIDAIAIIVNGRLVTTLEEFQDVLEASGYIEATVVLFSCRAERGLAGRGIEPREREQGEPVV